VAVYPSPLAPDRLRRLPHAGAIDEDGETILDAPASRRIFGTAGAALESCRTGQPVEVT
jgi:hypothetical protein